MIQSNLLKASLISGIERVTDGRIQSSFGNLSLTEVICFTWATHSSAYLLSVIICVQLKNPLLDHGMIAICPVSVLTSFTWLSLFHTENIFLWIILHSSLKMFFSSTVLFLI